MATNYFDKKKSVVPVTRVALLVCMAGGIAGCVHNLDAEAPNWPVDYRERHPVVVGNTQHTLPVAVSDKGLTGVSRRDVALVGSSARSHQSAITVYVPVGNGNDAAAQKTGQAVRDELQKSGVSARSIHVSPYSAATKDPNAPVKVTYSTNGSHPHVPHRCDVWPDALIATQNNASYWAHGCSTQVNFAAMLDNPHDLLEPRPATPRDRGRSDVVFDKYRKGEVTSSEKADENAGTVSEVGQQ